MSMFRIRVRNRFQTGTLHERIAQLKNLNAVFLQAGARRNVKHPMQKHQL